MTRIGSTLLVPLSALAMSCVRFGEGTSPDTGEGGVVSLDAALTDHFCSSLLPAPTFCDDFDDLSPGSRWDKVAQAGKASFDTTSFRSAPRAFLVTPDANSATYSAVYLARAESRLATSIHVAFETRFGGTFPSDVALIWSLEFDVAPRQQDGAALADATAGSMAASIVGAGARALFGDNPVGGSFKSRELAKAFKIDQWTRVEFDLTLDVPHVAIRLDGTTVLDEGLQPAWRPRYVTFRIGYLPLSNQAHAAFSTRVDNVIFDVK